MPATDHNGSPRGVRGRRDLAIERQVGAEVRRLREQAGLSLEEMAARMGLSPPRLRKLETATNIITVAQMARAAHVLAVSVATL